MHKNWDGSNWSMMHPDRAPLAWNYLTRDYSVLNGFDATAHKYSDKWYKAWATHIRGGESEDEVMARALSYARRIELDGYCASFYMRGAKFVHQAALDVESLRRHIDVTQPRYARTSDSKYFHNRVLAGVLDVLDTAERKYAQGVRIIGEGVFVVDYVDMDLIESGDFVDLDSFIRAVYQNGGTARSAFSAFKRVVTSLVPAGDAKSVEQDYFSNNRYLRSGVVLLETEAVERFVADQKEASKSSPSRTVAEQVLEMLAVEAPFSDQELHYVVFGEVQ